MPTKPARFSRYIVVLGLVLVLAAVAVLVRLVVGGPGAFVAGDDSSPSSRAVTSGPPTPTPRPTPSPSATSTKAKPGGTGARLRQVDGGRGFYGKFSPALPTDDSFFPIAVWFESVVEAKDTATDKDAGINTYVELTDNTDLGLVKAAGMNALVSNRGSVGKETVGWVLSDEADMWAGPGSGKWGGGDSCTSPSSPCGYTVQATTRSQLPGDNRLRYSNYGKGVAFWETNAEAARFVNQYQDILSVDTYWLTENFICASTEGGRFFGGRTLSSAECHRPSNYGRTVDRVRSLVSPKGSKPVWAFVEVGHPFTEDHFPTAKPDDVVAAVWSSIIHGARGIIYFNHSFGGSCQTQHALRDPCYASMRAAVKKLNGQIRNLAPVLNAPFADNVVQVGSGVDATAKWYDGHFYIIAGASRASAQTAKFALPCMGNATVTVVNEGRTIPIRKGSFSDRFSNQNTVHVYRVDGGSSCGAY